MIRRYTLLGGGAALLMAALAWFLRGLAPSTPASVLVFAGVALGCLVGWLVSRRDATDLRRFREVVEALTHRDLQRRVRLGRPGRIGELGRSIDALAERLARSEEKKHRRKDRLQTILDAMTEAVMVTDARGHIVLSNEVLTGLVGFDAGGHTATEAIRHPDFHRAIEDAQRGWSGSIEIELDGVDGGPRRVLRVSVSPLPDQQGVVSVFRDVTAERDAERVRRDFVANAGHELRTPLTAIRGFAETLREGAMDDPESARGFLDIIVRHTRRLQALVDDLADLSRFEGESLELELEPVAVGPLMGAVVHGLQSQSRAKSLNVTCVGFEDAPLVMADSRALEQVLVNLFDNAIKYTPEGGEVRIEVRANPGTVLIELGNSGPGIPAKHLPRVFERFYRVDAGRSRELGGTGLGLSIVKHLVAKLRGEIRVDSRDGWTRFELRVPRADSPRSDTGVSPG